MLSKSSYKLLEWFLSYENDWFYLAQVQRQYSKHISFELLKSLCDQKYLDCWMSPDAMPPRNEYEYPDLTFSISDQGKAYIERRRAKMYDTLVTRTIAVAALFISLMSLLLQWLR